MTLDEKLGQLTISPGLRADRARPSAARGERDSCARRQSAPSSASTAPTSRRKMQRVAVEESRLHIPLLFGYDVIHGYANDLPRPARRGGVVRLRPRPSARRASPRSRRAAMGLHWTFAPMVDIARDARWGRIVEGAGEDPYLGSVMAAARVRGFQGDDLRAPTSLIGDREALRRVRRRRGGTRLQRRRRRRADAVGGLPAAVRGRGARRRRLVHGVVQRDRRHAGARQPLAAHRRAARPSGGSTAWS